MKKFLKKAVAVLSFVACSGTVCNISVNDVSAATAERRQMLMGDIDGSGSTTISDAICLANYLKGVGYLNNYQLTQADINEDGIIDMADVQHIQGIGINLYPAATTKTKVIYSISESKEMSYCGYDYENKKNIKEYKLNFTTANTNQSDDTPMLYSEDIRDTGNYNVPILNFDDGSYASGLIVDNHVIATAAHCVYNNGKFVDNITVRWEAISPMEMKVKQVHIPVAYKEDGNAANGKYDYALIYVEDDLSNYKPWSIGIAATEFSKTQKDLTISGHANHNGVARYYNTGKMLYNDTTRIRSENIPYFGKYGGVTYYNNEEYGVKTAVGIATGSTDSSSVWSVKFTPDMLYFYKNNPNLK